MKGFIHSFESLAAVDGKGLRVAVFLSGCPLRCVYCHNPDTWHRGEKEIFAEDLFRKIVRYKPYFGSDGGVTFSGGEPLLQASFIQSVITYLRKEGIGYALDTSGAVELTDTVRAVFEGADEVLLDLKFWDEASYQKYTGASIEGPLKTLSYLNQIGKSCLVRTVVIPGINDSSKVLEKYLVHLKGMKCIRKYELLPFHTMGFFKYEKLGIPNPLLQTSPLSPQVKDELQRFVDRNMKE